jgi:enoyl-[acyl-carrier protein] reductase II
MDVRAAMERGADREELRAILGRARSKRGMFEGDMDEGELEIGQVSATINEIKPAAEILNDIIQEFNQANSTISSFRL